MQDEYYKPGKIRYTREQIKWLIGWLPLLDAGIYPKDPKVTGYTDTPIGKRQVKARASFIMAKDISTELKLRLSSCGIDALLLEFSVLADYDNQIDTEHKLASYLRTTDEDINFRIQTALRYCSGNCRRSMGCDKCLSLPRCMQKEKFRKRKGITYHRFLIERRKNLKRRRKNEL